MICPNCNSTEIPDSAHFCSNCGTSLRQTTKSRSVDKIIDYRELITRVTEDFFGRTRVRETVDDFLKAKSPRYFLLLGEPGCGKTAFMADLVKRRGYPHHFIGKGSRIGLPSSADWRNPVRFAESIGYQLLRDYGGWIMNWDNWGIHVDQKVRDLQGLLTGAEIDTFKAIPRATDRPRLSVEQEIEKFAPTAKVIGVYIEKFVMDVEQVVHQVLTTPLKTIAARWPEHQMVIVVDGLDEAEGYSDPQRNIFKMLPNGSLPVNVRLLLSSRPGEHLTNDFLSQAEVFWLSEDEAGKLDPHMIDDAKAFVQNLGYEESIHAMLKSHEPIIEIDELAAKVASASGGNFLYLYHYAQGLRGGDENLLYLETLPEGLHGIYEDFLSKIKERREDVPWDTAFKPALGTLAVAREPLARKQIADFSGVKQGTVGTILVKVEQFLDTIGKGKFARYSIYHQSFGEYLVSEDNKDYIDGPDAHRRIANYYWSKLHEDFSGCDEYGLLHLPVHAAQAGMLDKLVKDILFLVMADPGELWRVLVTHGRDLPREIVHIYQGAIHHLQAAPFAQRASYLQMVARQNGMNKLADQFDQLPFPLQFSALWAVWQPTMTHRIVASNVGVVGSNLEIQVTAGVASYEGCIVVVTGCRDGAVRVWDVATGKQVGDPLRGHSGPITAVGAGEFDHRTIIVSGGTEGNVYVWDLEMAHPIAGPLRSRAYGGSPARTFALQTVAGRPVIVSGGSHGNVEVWDITTGQPVGEPMQAFGGVVHWVALSIRENQPVILSLHNDRVLRVWGFATGHLVGEGISTGCFNYARVRSIAVGTLDGFPIVIAGGGDGNIRAWNIATAEPVIEPLSGHHKPIRAMTNGEMFGNSVIITGDSEGTIRIWDLAARRLLEESIRLHDGAVTSLSMVNLDGRSVVVSGGSDGTLRAWEVADCSSIEVKRLNQLRGFSVSSMALGEMEGCPVVVTGGYDGVIRVWDLVTGLPVGEPLQAHVNPVEHVTVVGTVSSPLIVSAANDPTLDVSDWETHQRLGERIYGNEVNYIRKLSVGTAFQTGDGRIWMKDREGSLFLSGIGEEEDTEEATAPPSVQKHVADALPVHGHGATTTSKTVPPGLHVIQSYGSGRRVLAWSLSTGHVIGKPISGDYGGCESVSTAILDGRKLILTGELNGTISVWDLATGQPVGVPLNNQKRVNVLSAVEVDGRPIVVSGDNEGTVRAWDLATGMSMGEPLRGRGSVSLLELAKANGCVVIGCLRYKTIDFTDLATGSPIGRSILAPGHVISLAMGEVEDRLSIITADLRDSIRIWEATGNVVGEINVDASLLVIALAPDSRIVVGSSRGLMVLKWNRTGQAFGAREH